jgi:hypothetical protein
VVHAVTHGGGRGFTWLARAVVLRGVAMRGHMEARSSGPTTDGAWGGDGRGSRLGGAQRLADTQGVCGTRPDED